MYRSAGRRLHAVEQLVERGLQLVAAQAAAVDLQAARERVADRVHGVQRRERVLEDHLDLAARTAGTPVRSSSSRPRRAAGSGRRSRASAARAAARSSTCRSRTRRRGRRPCRGRARGPRRRRRARPSCERNPRTGKCLRIDTACRTGVCGRRVRAASSPCAWVGPCVGAVISSPGEESVVRAGGSAGAVGAAHAPAVSSGHHRAEHLTTTHDHRSAQLDGLSFMTISAACGPVGCGPAYGLSASGKPV